MASLRTSQLRGWMRRAWDSDRGAACRFYGHYLRWPLALALVALVGEKTIFYGVLPLTTVAAREWHYLRAEHDYQEGQDPEALAQIREALLTSRDEPALWRLAAEITDRLDSPDTAYCWQQVDRLEPGVPETQLALADAALRHDQIPLAAAALREVSPEQEGRVAYLAAAGQEKLAEGNADQAAYFLAAAEALRPSDPRVLFALAEWHATRCEWPQARALLTGLAARSTLGLEAWRKIVDLDVREGDFRAARVDEVHLLEQPGAAFADRVRMLGFTVNPVAVAADLLRGASAEDAKAVLEWMAAHGEAEAALIWIRTRDEKWQDDSALGQARSVCLEALGEWVHLRDDQRDSFWPGRESTRLMLLARASLALGRTDDMRAAWQGAVAACASPEDFTALVDAAAAFPNADEARAIVWLAMARRYPGEQWPLRSLLRYDLACGDLVAAQEVAAQLAALVRDDASLGATRDLLGLLRGTEVAQAAADLVLLEKRQPADPTVAIAAAYALYLQGRFGEALALLGSLDPTEVQTPEWAPYVGQLLAAGGPPRQAETVLQTALAQPRLLECQQRSVQRSLDLVNARQVLAGLLHPADPGARSRAAAFFAARAESGQAVYLMGAAVSDAGDPSRAATDLARIDPTTLDRPELLLNEGAVLAVADSLSEAEPWLTFSPDLPIESPAAAWHRIVEAWWKIESRAPADATVVAGLLGAYRGLDAAEPDAAFWRRDEARELALTRGALEAGQAADAVQTRLEALLHRVPGTATIEAQVGYALFLQGRVEAGRQRLEVLSAAELTQAEPARYYAAILRACGKKKQAGVTLFAAHNVAPRTP